VGHRIGLLFLAVGGCYAVSVACLGLLSDALVWSPSAERVIDIVGITVWVPAFTVCLPLILQLYPDGRPLAPRWRWLVGVTLALTAFSGVLTLQPGALANELIADRSDVLPEAAGRVVALLTPAVAGAYVVVLLLSVLVLILRAVRSRAAARAQVLWLVWAVAVVVVLNGQRIVTAEGPILFLLTVPLIPAAATVAIVRHQLYDIRLIINRSLVYGLLSLGVVGVYLGIVAGLSRLATDRLSPLLATAVVAVAFAPARSGLQTAVDRMMYGHRRDPAQAAARVGTRLATGLDGVVQAVCESLRLPYAAIRSADTEVAVAGTVGEATETIPLEVADGPPACLVVGVRTGEEHLSPVDRRALHLLAAPVGLAVQAVRLSQEHQRSRMRVVTAREEERRRLRRDLHDGLATALAAVTLKADAAYNLREADPTRCAELLLGLRADLTTAIADIRRLVYDLRPPDLDEVGLVGALRAKAAQTWRREGTPFVVTVDAEPLPQLPAAVELAAYRIIIEAVTNARRHGPATRCDVSVRLDDALHLQVRDNNPTHPAQPWRHGVGLRSMHERATELGGTLTAGPTIHGGLVGARLPLEHA